MLMTAHELGLVLGIRKKPRGTKVQAYVRRSGDLNFLDTTINVSEKRIVNMAAFTNLIMTTDT
ncbi:hypothetical protein AINA4_11640 [Aurantimicrobium sp. INA4]|nr:hypothetical protein AINA4_11640 [Aurantimicrobium sp. INA4]